MNMNTLHDNLNYCPDDIAETLLQKQYFSYEGARPDFNKSAIIDIVYWIKAAAANQYNNDAWRQFYNLLAAITDAEIIPF